MTAHFRVRETVFTHDGTELAAVQWFTADGIDCGRIEVPLDKWCSFIGEAAKPWPFNILERDVCGCGHDAHVGDACLAAIHHDGITESDERCTCGTEDWIEPPPVAEPDGRLRLIGGDKAVDLAEDDLADWYAERNEVSS